MKRKKNIYFDRKSLGWKLGKKPLSKAERKRKAAIARQDKAHAKMMEQDARKRARKESGGQFRQIRSEAKKEQAGRDKAEARAKLSTKDRELWEELLRQNPAKARKVLEGMAMATKKRKRKKKMPAGLKAYWLKKRRQKNARKAKRRKNSAPKKRRRVRRRKPAARRRRRVQNRRPARRRRRTNPRRRRSTKIIKTNLRKGTKAFRQFVSQMRAKYGSARVL
jgi:hypothetical protein